MSNALDISLRLCYAGEDLLSWTIEDGNQMCLDAKVGPGQAKLTAGFSVAIGLDLQALDGSML